MQIGAQMRRTVIHHHKPIFNIPKLKMKCKWSRNGAFYWVFNSCGKLQLWNANLDERRDSWTLPRSFGVCPARRSRTAPPAIRMGNPCREKMSASEERSSLSAITERKLESAARHVVPPAKVAASSVAEFAIPGDSRRMTLLADKSLKSNDFKSVHQSLSVYLSLSTYNEWNECKVRWFYRIVSVSIILLHCIWIPAKASRCYHSTSTLLILATLIHMFIMCMDMVHALHFNTSNNERGNKYDVTAMLPSMTYCYIIYFLGSNF